MIWKSGVKGVLDGHATDSKSNILVFFWFVDVSFDQSRRVSVCLECYPRIYKGNIPKCIYKEKPEPLKTSTVTWFIKPILYVTTTSDIEARRKRKKPEQWRDKILSTQRLVIIYNKINRFTQPQALYLPGDPNRHKNFLSGVEVNTFLTRCQTFKS